MPISNGRSWEKDKLFPFSSMMIDDSHRFELELEKQQSSIVDFTYFVRTSPIFEDKKIILSCYSIVLRQFFFIRYLYRETRKNWKFLSPQKFRYFFRFFCSLDQILYSTIANNDVTNRQFYISSSFSKVLFNIIIVCTNNEKKMNKK